jgi:hypothetical protein
MERGMQDHTTWSPFYLWLCDFGITQQAQRLVMK